MFLCKNCYKKMAKREGRDKSWWDFLAKSFGPCEECKKSAECVNG